MVGFFPRESIRWAHLDEPPMLRRLSITLWAPAIVAGVGVRIAHATLFGLDAGSWLVASAYGAILVLLMCGSLTAHEGNFTVRSWVWRVPAFALVAAAAESLTSLALILLGVDRMGADRAVLVQWPLIAITIVGNRMLLLAAFGALLAASVEVARFALYKPAEREAMDVEAVAEVASATAEHEPPAPPQAS